MDKKELHTLKFYSGQRTYYFDITSTLNESKYVNIIESRRKSGSFEKNELRIYEKDIKKFIDTLKVIRKKIENEKEAKVK